VKEIWDKPYFDKITAQISQEDSVSIKKIDSAEMKQQPCLLRQIWANLAFISEMAKKTSVFIYAHYFTSIAVCPFILMQQPLF